MTDSPRPLILVADDDADDLQLISKALTRSGYDIDQHVARNGRDVLQFIKDGARPNLLILDLNMPLLNGHEVLQQLSSLKLLEHLAVVIFSTSVERTDRNNCLRLGARQFVSKPTVFSEYCDLMKAFLDEYVVQAPQRGES